MSQTQSYISEIIPSVVMLTKCLDKVTPFGLGTFMETLNGEIKKRFSQLEENNNCCIATLLDPRYKDIFFHNQDLAKLAKQQLLVESLKLQNEDENNVEEIDGNTSDSSSITSTRTTGSNNSSSPTQSQKRRKISIFDSYKEVVQQGSGSHLPIKIRSKDKTLVSISEQVESYLKMPLRLRQEDPIIFWREHKKLFPELYRLVVRFLSAPPSSVYSERTFSEAGLIYEDRRNRLTPRNAEKLIFIHHNLPKVCFEY